MLPAATDFIKTFSITAAMRVSRKLIWRQPIGPISVQLVLVTLSQNSGFDVPLSLPGNEFSTLYQAKHAYFLLNLPLPADETKIAAPNRLSP